DRQSDAGGAAARRDRYEHGQRRETPQREQHRGPRRDHARPRVGRLQQQPRQIDEGLRADHQRAGRDTARTEDGERRHRERERRDHFSGEHLDPAARTRQYGLPGTVAILGRKDVAAGDAGEDGEGPERAETEYDERDREAGVGHRAAEERVGRQVALYTHGDSEHEWAGGTGYEEQAHLPLRQQLRPLDTGD